jgi:hypothetical protein
MPHPGGGKVPVDPSWPLTTARTAQASLKMYHQIQNRQAISLRTVLGVLRNVASKARLSHGVSAIKATLERHPMLQVVW